MNRTKLLIGFAAFAAMLLMNFIYAAKGYGNSSSFVQSMIASVSGGSSGSSGGGGGMSSSTFVGEEESGKTAEDLSEIKCGYEYEHYYVWVTDAEGETYRSFVGTTTYCNGKAISKYTGEKDGYVRESKMQSYYQGNKCVKSFNPFSTCKVHVFTCEFHVSCR